MVDSTYYTTVVPPDVKKGDIALWINEDPLGGGDKLFHTGIVVDVNPTGTAGKFFGAQTRKGPSFTYFGTKDPAFYWPIPTKFLRAKEEYRTGAAEQPTPAPAPAPTPAGPEPVLNFQFPIRKADGKQFDSANELYTAIENETSGQYLWVAITFGTVAFILAMPVHPTV